jgi:mRNA-degrading endonuclease YafQ of YafQ-DinJ toxin-antitoxin module
LKKFKDFTRYINPQWLIIKNSIETFNKSIEKLIKKLNFKNLLLRLMRDNLFTRLPSHSLLENIKNIAECSIQYYELTLKINESIKNSNVSNFKFDENKPIDSFNRGIDLFNKVTNVMIKGLEKLKEIIENVVKFQRLIIEDDTFPLPIENKMIVLDKMKKIKFYEVKNYKDIIDEKECVICFNEFKNNEYVKIFGCGKHIFHEDCIKEWLQQDFRCPLCKYSIKKDLLNDLY